MTIISPLFHDDLHNDKTIQFESTILAVILNKNTS